MRLLSLLEEHNLSDVLVRPLRTGVTCWRTEAHPMSTSCTVDGGGQKGTRVGGLIDLPQPLCVGCIPPALKPGGRTTTGNPELFRSTPYVANTEVLGTANDRCRSVGGSGPETTPGAARGLAWPRPRPRLAAMPSTAEAPGPGCCSVGCCAGHAAGGPAAGLAQKPRPRPRIFVSVKPRPRPRIVISVSLAEPSPNATSSCC